MIGCILLFCALVAIFTLLWLRVLSTSHDLREARSSARAARQRLKDIVALDKLYTRIYRSKIPPYWLRCYQCCKPVAWLAPDSRCANCTRCAPEEL